MSSISFDNVWLLFIALPIAVLLVIPFAIAIRKDNVNGHNIASAVIHIVMAILIAFSAAGTYIVTTVTKTDVYVVADVSYSANLNLDTVDEYIEELSGNLPDNSRMGVVCFGRNYKLITALGKEFTTVKDSGVDDSSTNIVDALEYTSNLFRDDVIKRIVLITDGRATDGNDSSDLQAKVNELNKEGVYVDAIYLDDNVMGDVEEIQLSSVDYTQSVSLGATEKATVTVDVNCADGDSLTAKITLKKDGEDYKTIAPTLSAGSHTVSFDLDTSEEGDIEYSLTAEYEGDNNGKNNTLSFTQIVSGNVETLLITTNSGDEATLLKYSGENAFVTTCLVDADAAEEGNSMPYYTLEKLCLFDRIILSDVDVTTLENYSVFLSNLDKAVSVYGKSLLTFGDTNIQGHSDGALQSLSDMLPVVYGKSVSAPKEYVIVIDNSRSMRTLEKLTRAKTAAKQILNMISDSDYLGIVNFCGESYTTSAVMPIGDNRTILANYIDNLTVRQGTIISSGLKAASDLLGEDTGIYGERRVILISDGLNGSDSTEPTEVATSLRTSQRAYTSTLDVGRGNDTGSEATKAQSLLQEVAEKGGGKYIDISTDDDLEEAINGALPDDIGDYNGESSRVYVNALRDEVLDSDVLTVDNGDVLSGSFVASYIKSTAKANATEVLYVQYENLMYASDGITITSSSWADAPLYAYWQYGSGKVASLTSSLNTSWLSTTVDGEEVREALYTNILATNIPEEKNNYPFLTDISRDTNAATVSLQPSQFRSGGVAQVTVTAPGGTSQTATMSYSGSAYSYKFVTAQTGQYKVTVKYSYVTSSGEEVSFETTRYLNVDYSAEYDSFASYDPSALIVAVSSSGKVVTDGGDLVIENDSKKVGQYFVYLTMPLLATCAALYAIDVAVRKLKWEDIRSLFKGGKNTGGKNK